jgi:hypothetical protein
VKYAWTIINNIQSIGHIYMDIQVVLKLDLVKFTLTCIPVTYSHVSVNIICRENGEQCPIFNELVTVELV